MNICECGEPTSQKGRCPRCPLCREEARKIKAQREREIRNLPYYLKPEDRYKPAKRDKSRKMNREIEGVFPN
jgi:hypothetical protein